MPVGARGRWTVGSCGCATCCASLPAPSDFPHQCCSGLLSDAVSTSGTPVCFFSSGPLVLAFSALWGNGIWVGREDLSHQPLVAQIKGLLRPLAIANIVLVWFLGLCVRWRRKPIVFQMQNSWVPPLSTLRLTGCRALLFCLLFPFFRVSERKTVTLLRTSFKGIFSCCHYGHIKWSTSRRGFPDVTIINKIV